MAADRIQGNPAIFNDQGIFHSEKWFRFSFQMQGRRHPLTPEQCMPGL
jgi:hypothetical protein